LAFLPAAFVHPAAVSSNANNRQMPACSSLAAHLPIVPTIADRMNAALPVNR
jgi:hypothetical protein